MKSVAYESYAYLNCSACGGEVIVCVDDSKTVSGAPFIEMTLVTPSDSVMDCCGRTKYLYGLTYDETLLVEPYRTNGLGCCDITGLFCRGCLTDWVEWLISNIEPPVPPASGWALLGNAATVDGTNFLGTTDAIPFTLRVENESAIRIDTDRNYIFDYASGADNKNFIYGTVASSCILSGRGQGIGVVTNAAWPGIYYEADPAYISGIATNTVIAGGLQNAIVSATNHALYTATAENSGIFAGTNNNIVLQVQNSATENFNNSNSVICGGDGNWIFQTNPQDWGFGNVSKPQWFDYINNSIIGGTDNWIEFSMNSAVEACDGAYLTCNWGAFVGGGNNHFIYGGSPDAINYNCGSLGGDGHWLGIAGASRYCSNCTMVGNYNVYITPQSAGEMFCCSIIATKNSYMRANYLATLPVKHSVMIGTESTVLDNQAYSCVIGGHNHVLDAGVAHTVGRNTDNAIIAGDSNEVSDSQNCGIFTGQWNDLYTSTYAAILGGSYNNLTGSANSVILGGSHNAIATGSATSSHLGGNYLTLGTRSTGFSGTSGSTTANVSAFSGVAYFGDVDLWIANIGSTAAKVKFFEPNATTNFSTTNYSSIEAQAQGANIEYKLPATAGTPGQVLTIDTVVGTVVTLKWA